MGKTEISLRSSCTTKILRPDRAPTVFSRSIIKLSEDKRHPGKITRLYVNIDDDYKVFGALTFNTGGSISFFPDFYRLNSFDHITLPSDFIKNKAHFTMVESDGRHRKIVNFVADQLSTGDFNLLTFAMVDSDLLMDSLPETKFPDIEFDNDHEEEFISLLKDAIDNPPIMLSFPSEEGAYFIQIVAFPKGKNIEDISITLGFEEVFLSDKSSCAGVINAKKVEILTPDNFDFSICISCFKINRKLCTQFAILTAPVS